MLGSARPSVDIPGLPEWLQIVITVACYGIAFAIIFGLFKLAMIPAGRRYRRRVAAVEAAAGDDPIFGSEAVHVAATSLLKAVYQALDAGDRRGLARFCDKDLLDYWQGRLDAYARDGYRFRAKVIKGPRVDYLGVMDRPGAGDDWVGVRMRGKLRLCLERPDGTTRALPDTPGQKRVPFDDYWTLYRRDGEWIVGSIQAVTARNEKTYTTEEFVGP